MKNKAKKFIGKQCKILLITGQNAYWKIIGVDTIWLLTEKVEDFHRDGYSFYPWTAIENIYYRKQEKFFEHICNFTSKKKPDIWLQDFESFFSAISDRLLMIEKKDGKSVFCKILTINKKYVMIKTFDAYAQREKKEKKISYTDIFCVDFDNEYLMTYKKYMEKHI
ncbi:MAG: hypothetical protein ACD_80C00120G0005 [uncultured bacterium (gcode 4)]|uniref:Uncharacterized protein n=1 Tax=uncultured bacterium (gcode 4) TaxID=1234023 RepID=K1XIS4_9BACT|nr:MAG: hypothetical protein ACD_80C00120G0005 [uncultured bacterium (gcode 4)]